MTTIRTCIGIRNDSLVHTGRIEVGHQGCDVLAGGQPAVLVLTHVEKTCGRNDVFILLLFTKYKSN